MYKTKLSSFISEYGDGIHGTPIYSNNGEYYFINGNNLDNGYIVIDIDTLRVDSEQYEKIRRPLNDRTVLLSINGTLGKTAFYHGEKIALGKSACYINIKKECSKEFFRYILTTKEFQRYMLLVAHGSTIKNFAPSQVGEYEVEIPDINEQESIANLLSSIDSKIFNNKVICSELEAMAKLLYDYWFVQFDFPDENGKPYKSSGGKMVWNEELKRDIPDGWTLTTIGDITICHDSERVPVASKDRETMKGDIPYYGATGIMGYVNSHIFDGDYVLMAEDGSIMDDKGYPILQRISGKTWVNNHAHVLEPIKGYSCKMLLMMFKDIPVRLIKTGSIQMKINQDNMNAYKLIDIPEKIKMKAQAILDKIDEQQLALQQENQELASLRDFLLPMLMNGQVKVKE